MKFNRNIISLNWINDLEIMIIRKINVINFRKNFEDFNG